MNSGTRTLPNLDTFVYVGTASICGTNLTHCNILEDQSPSTSAAHVVRYCYTKMVGETNVTRAIPREKLLVVRPSIIMGDTRDWTFVSNAGSYEVKRLRVLVLVK